MFQSVVEDWMKEIGFFQVGVYWHHPINNNHGRIGLIEVDYLTDFFRVKHKLYRRLGLDQVVEFYIKAEDLTDPTVFDRIMQWHRSFAGQIAP